jgi:acyl-CoA thioesterase-1
VLLIGDSISIGYTVPVRKLLAKKANVHRIPTNGGDTVRGFTSMDKWLGKKPWDVIHFNFGLHDLKRLKGKKYDVGGKQVRSPKEYAKNLEKIVVRLKKTGATLIWASTTPVPEAARGRLQGDSVIFNREAAKIMKKHGVRVNDLYTYISPKLGKAQKPRDVHFTTAGKTLLGKKVAAEIETALKERRKTTKRKTNAKK